METGKYCAYNVTRNALLSERVVEVKDDLAPEQFLPLLLNGPAMDRREALWVKELAAVTKAPRLFGYEVVYLDDDQRVAEVAAIGPAKAFPALREAVRSVLVLHDRRVTETGTVAGDQVRLCGEAELAALMRTAPQFHEMRPQVEPSQRISTSQGLGEQMFSPEFVFQPFGGSLVYLPDGSNPHAHSSEIFLTFKSAEADVATVSAENVEAIELMPVPALPEVVGIDVQEVHEEVPSTVNEPLKEKAPEPEIQQVTPEPVTSLSEPDLKEANEETARPLPERKQKKAPDPDIPHFHHPERIRFFDPVTGLEADDTPGEIAARAGEGPRSTELSPELKAAIWRIDEQRRDREERNDQSRTQEKKPKEKKQKAPKRGLTRLFQSPVVDVGKPKRAEEVADASQAAEASQPVAADAPAVERTPVRFEPVQTEHIQLEPLDTESVRLEPVQDVPVPLDSAGAEIASKTAFGQVASAKEEIAEDVAPPETPAIVLQSVEAIEAPTETADSVAKDEPVIALQPEEVQTIPAGEVPAAVEAVVLPAEEAAEKITETPSDPAPSAVEEMDLKPEEVTPEEVTEEIPEVPAEVAKAPVEAISHEPQEAIEQPTAAFEDLPAPSHRTPTPLETSPVVHARVEEKLAETKVVEDRPTKRHSVPPVRETPARREVSEPFVAARAAREEPAQEIVEAPAPVKKKPKKKFEKAPEPAFAKPSLGARLQRLLSGESNALSGNRRRGDRINVPGLVAYYWSGGAPKAHEIVNISRTGFYLRTSDLWLPDTLVQMTLQRPKEDEAGAQRRSIGVLARVVRIDDNGVGHEFVTSEDLLRRRTREILPQKGTSRKELQKFLEIK